MKFKIDENLPVEFADLLRAAHHDAMTVLAEGLRGQRDPTIVNVCQQENRILVTLDLDFADIHAYPPSQFPGLIVLRPAVAGQAPPGLTVRPGHPASGPGGPRTPSLDRRGDADPHSHRRASVRAVLSVSAPTVRLAIAGGRRGASFGRALAALADQVTLAAICDVSEDALADWRLAHPGVPAYAEWEPLWAHAPEYEHPRWREWGAAAAPAGHGGGDFFVLRDFADAVRSGARPPIDVDDAATWSAILPLSAASVHRGGAPVDVPDFRPAGVRRAGR